MDVVEGSTERKQNNLFSLKSCHTNKPQFLQLKKKMFIRTLSFSLFFFFGFETLQFRIQLAAVQF